MNLKRKFFLIFSLFCLFFLILKNPINADGQFTTDYDINYQVFENGKTTVTQKISLKNLTSDYYVSQYSLTLKLKDVHNIKAWDNIGPLNITVEKQAEDTQIKFAFNEKTVGKDRVLVWHLSYQTTEIAHHNGRIWEINIPKVLNSQNIQNYNVNLQVPSSFGKMLYAKPMPLKNFYWTKNQIVKSGVNIVFGDYQIFKFKLNYHLKNPKIYPVKTEIALPPDTDYQKIRIEKIIPEPLDVILDNDGNWLAKYQLSPNEKIDIIVTGFAEIHLQPQKFAIFSNAAAYQNIPSLEKYLKPQKYWEVNNSEIQKLARELKTPEKIYNFVVAKLSYDYNRITAEIERLGAVQSLKNPQSAICMEFTDLFIALARSAGIPARELDGFAFTNDPKIRPLSLKKDILHSWPEYYDFEKQTWIMVDPTWENTTNGIDYFHTFDLNHFVFIIRGEESEWPYPAGSYKDKNSQNKDIEISFANQLPPESSHKKLEVSFEIPEKTFSGFSLSGSLTIKNKSQNFSSESMMNFSSSHYHLSPNEYKLSNLPPFAKKEIHFGLSGSRFWEKKKVKITALINNEEFSTYILFQPIWHAIFSFFKN